MQIANIYKRKKKFDDNNIFAQISSIGMEFFFLWIICYERRK